MRCRPLGGKPVVQPPEVLWESANARWLLDNWSHEGRCPVWRGISVLGLGPNSLPKSLLFLPEQAAVVSSKRNRHIGKPIPVLYQLFERINDVRIYPISVRMTNHPPADDG